MQGKMSAVVSYMGLLSYVETIELAAELSLLCS